MNDNSPVNQLVMAINMPQGIRSGYVVLVLGFDPTIL